MDLGVAPARRFHHSVQMMSVALLRGRYADFGLTFATKKLAERPMALGARTGRWTYADSAGQRLCCHIAS
jgi:hypothetical protein